MTHAEVENGQIKVRFAGRLEPVRPFTAWSEWLALQSSPNPATQQRAREIRGALNEIGYLQ